MLRLQNTPEYGILCVVCCPILILHWFECLVGIVKGEDCQNTIQTHVSENHIFMYSIKGLHQK